MVRGSLWPLAAGLLAMTLVASVLALRTFSRVPADVAPNIVLIQIDTLRADHVGCYGYRRATTPNLDRFARAGVQFRNAYSTTSWTLPAVASLFTGLLPSRHGVRAVGDVLADFTPTLALGLQQNGYTTGAISSNFAFVNPGPNYPDPPLHFRQGFDTFQVLFQATRTDDREGELIFGQPIRTARADAVTGKMDEFVRLSNEPFFLFALYIDPHYGYDPPPDYARLFEPHPTHSHVTGLMQDVLQLADPLSPEDIQHLVNLYDGEVRYTDELIGDFLAALDDSGAADRTIVVILADHGEAFREHGRMLHGQSLYENTVRIPLLIRGPGIPHGTVVDQPVSITDVMPTLLDLAGVPAPKGIDGQSLVPTWKGATQNTERSLAFELDNEPDLLNGAREHARALRQGPWKLITSINDKAELYDLATDPRETHDLAAAGADVIRNLRVALVNATRAVSTPAVHPTLTDAEKERVKALGYGTGPE
jgi:arylsulfatase A-like enzyme